MVGKGGNVRVCICQVFTRESFPTGLTLLRLAFKALKSLPAWNLASCPGGCSASPLPFLQSFPHSSDLAQPSASIYLP